MANFHSLPPAPEPKRKTAYVRPKNLEEHFLTFLNVNNATGFLEDETRKVVVQNFFGRVFQYSQNRTTTLEHFFQVTDELHELVLEMRLPTRIFVSDVRKLMARVLGYQNVTHLVRGNGLTLDKDEYNRNKPIPNRLPAEKVAKVVMSPKHSKDEAIVRKLTIWLKTLDVNGPRPECDLSTIEGQLVRFSWFDHSSLEFVKKVATDIKKLSNKELRHSTVLNILAVAFGYEKYQEMLASVDAVSRVYNRRKFNKESS